MLDNFARLNPHLSDPSGVIDIPLFYYRFMVDNYPWKYPCSFLFFPWPWDYQKDYFSSHLGLFSVGILLFILHFLLFCQLVLPKQTLPFCFNAHFCLSLLNYERVLGLWGPPVFSQIACGFLWASDATSTSEPHFHALLLVRLRPNLFPSCSEWWTPSPCLTTILAAPGRDLTHKAVFFSSTDLQWCPFTSQAASTSVLNMGIYKFREASYFL